MYNRKPPLVEFDCVAQELDTNRGASQGDSDELISSQRRAWSTYNHFPFFACVYYSPDFEHSLVECIIFPAFVDLGFCLRVGIFNLYRFSHLPRAIRSLQVKYGRMLTIDNNLYININNNTRDAIFILISPSEEQGLADLRSFQRL